MTFDMYLTARRRNNRCPGLDQGETRGYGIVPTFPESVDRWLP
jgi:hypothetical protein